MFNRILSTFLGFCACWSLAAQAPNMPALPMGTATACPNGNFQYTIPPVPNATFYLWKAPVGGLVNGVSQLPLSVQAPDGESVVVSFGSATGNVCVAAGNNDGISAYSCKFVNVVPIPPTVLPTLTICYEDLPYVMPDGVIINVAGTATYQWVLESVHGCDSIIRQKVIVRPPIIRNLGQIYSCDADTGCYYYHGLLLCQEGYFQEVFSSYDGCDSLVFGYFERLPITVSILPAQPVLGCINGSVTLSAQTNFLNATYTWKNAAGQVVGYNKNLLVHTPGTYTVILKGPNNCMATYSVVVPDPAPSVTITALAPPNPDCQNPQTILQANAIPANAVYAWGSPTGYTSNLQNPIVSQGGTYTVTVTNANNGCTATKSITVVSETRRDTVTAQICSGESFAGYAQAGTYVDTLLTHPCGCYDIRVLTIEAVTQKTYHVNATICPGAQYATYTQSGVYQDLFVSAGGCDSLRILQLTVTPDYTLDALATPDNGNQTGQINLTVQGGQGPFHFAWSNGDTTQTPVQLSSGFYFVSVTDAFDCTKHLAVKVPFMLDSVPPVHTLAGLELFPNPASDQFWVNMPAAGRLYMVDALTGQRQPMVQMKAGTGQIDVGTLPTGMYWVVIESDRFGVLVRRMLILR